MVAVVCISTTATTGLILLFQVLNPSVKLKLITYLSKTTADEANGLITFKNGLRVMGGDIDIGVGGNGDAVNLNATRAIGLISTGLNKQVFLPQVGFKND